MSTIIIIAVVLFILKFVYDSFLTDNTDKKFEEFSQSNPEAAARVLNNSGGVLGNKAKRNKSVQEESIKKLAEFNNWEISEVKMKLLENIASEINSRETYFEVMKGLQKEKAREAVIRKIDPDDTCAAVSFDLTHDLFEEVFETSNPPTDTDKVKALISIYPELEEKLKMEGIGKTNSFIMMSPDYNYIWNDIVGSDDFVGAYFYYLAADYYERKHIGLLLIIGNVMETLSVSKIWMSKLLVIMAKLTADGGNHRKGIETITTQIEAYKNSSDMNEKFYLAELFSERAKIKLLADDDDGFRLDAQKAKELLK